MFFLLYPAQWISVCILPLHLYPRLLLLPAPTTGAAHKHIKCVIFSLLLLFRHLMRWLLMRGWLLILLLLCYFLKSFFLADPNAEGHHVVVTLRWRFRMLCCIIRKCAPVFLRVGEDLNGLFRKVFQFFGDQVKFWGVKELIVQFAIILLCEIEDKIPFVHI